MAGWGSGPWGVMPWGGGAGATPAFDVAQAFATGDRMLRVVLSAEPRHVASTKPGDALNPRTWAITAASPARTLTVLSVAEQDSLTYDLFTLEPFDRHPGLMAVAYGALRSGVGGAPATTSASFAGCVREDLATPQRQATTRGFGGNDLANRPAPSSHGIPGAGGTLEIAGGDYRNVDGPELVRKLMIRRLMTTPGDFFHLPAYGVGLRVKEPLPTSDLVKLKGLIERQMRLEPEVEAVTASLQIDAANNVLTVRLKARLHKTGQQVDVSVPVRGSVGF